MYEKGKLGIKQENQARSVVAPNEINKRVGARTRQPSVRLRDFTT